MAERKLSNWLMSYAEYTAGSESPESFHQWVGLSTIAAAAQRKIMMDLGYFHVHSNMFVVLVSPPGRSRKSTALKIGKGILKGIPDYGTNVYFSTQASSVAAMVKQMSTIPDKEHQSMTAFISELGSLLGSKSIEMTDFLTDIYDCEPDWDKQTVGRGLEKIERPWLNLMGATTPQWLGDNLSQTAVEGGFVSRTIFVYDDTRKRVAFPELTDNQRILHKALTHDLAEIAKLKGTATLDPEARAFYTHWYEEIHGQGHVDPRIMGFYERKHIHVLKVALAVSLSENNSLVIKARDVDIAIQWLGELEDGMSRAFSAVGKNIFSTDMERMKMQVAENPGGLTLKQIVAANIYSVEKDQIMKLLDALITTGEIVRQDLGGGKFLFKPPTGGNRGYTARHTIAAGTEGTGNGDSPDAKHTGADGTASGSAANPG